MWIVVVGEGCVKDINFFIKMWFIGVGMLFFGYFGFDRLLVVKIKELGVG